MRGIYGYKVPVVLRCLRKTHHCDSAARYYLHGIGRVLSMTDDGLGQCSQGGQKPLDQTKSGTVGQQAGDALDHDSSLTFLKVKGAVWRFSRAKDVVVMDKG